MTDIGDLINKGKNLEGKNDRQRYIDEMFNKEEDGEYDFDDWSAKIQEIEKECKVTQGDKIINHIPIEIFVTSDERECCPSKVHYAKLSQGFLRYDVEVGKYGVVGIQGNFGDNKLQTNNIDDIIVELILKREDCGKKFKIVLKKDFHISNPEGRGRSNKAWSCYYTIPESLFKGNDKYAEVKLSIRELIEDEYMNKLLPSTKKLLDEDTYDFEKTLYGIKPFSELINALDTIGAISIVKEVPWPETPLFGKEKEEYWNKIKPDFSFILKDIKINIGSKEQIMYKQAMSIFEKLPPEVRNRIENEMLDKYLRL